MRDLRQQETLRSTPLDGIEVGQVEPMHPVKRPECASQGYGITIPPGNEA